MSRRSYLRSRSRSRSCSRSRSPPPHHHHRSHRSPRPTRNSDRHEYRPRSRGGVASPPASYRRNDGAAGNDEIERLDPSPSKVLGVFGMSTHTEERDIRRIFSKFGRINSIQVVFDRRTGRSRGFGFIYYDRVEDAQEAKRGTHGLEIDGQRIRVDFSLTEKAHDRTPGVYMGAPENQRMRDHNDYRSSSRRHSRSRSRSRHRSGS